MPQFSQPHVLLLHGADLMEQLLPGLKQDITDAGATPWDAVHNYYYVRRTSITMYDAQLLLCMTHNYYLLCMTHSVHATVDAQSFWWSSRGSIMHDSVLVSEGITMVSAN